MSGAYWRAETLDGVVFLELEEGGDHERYLLVDDTTVVHERVIQDARASSDLANSVSRSGSEVFMVVVGKEGYVTIVRHLIATGGVCHLRNVEGDREFRLVKAPLGEDDISSNEDSVTVCPASLISWETQVVDNETGMAITGAYWLVATLDGEIAFELEEGGDQEHYPLRFSGVVSRRVSEAGFENIRIVVAKEGYVTIVRNLTAIGGVCGVSRLEASVALGLALEFRLVRGLRGEYDIFRRVR